MKKPSEAKTILYEPSRISTGCKKYRVFQHYSNDELFLKENGGGGRREFHRVPFDRLVSPFFSKSLSWIPWMHPPPIPPKD